MSIRLQLTDMAHGGQALGRYEGKVVFVPYALPGEEVAVEVVRDRGRYAEARLLEVLRSSPERVEPRCPHFGACGGCQWQHATYRAQLRFKEGSLRDQLRRIGGIEEPPVLPALGMEEPWSYRNHVQFHLDEAGHLGFMAALSHEVVPIEVCYIIHPLIAEVFHSLDLALPDLRRLSIRVSTSRGQKLLILEMAQDMIPALEVDEPLSCVLFLADGTLLTLVGDSYLVEEVRGRAFRVSASSFFQVNTAQLERMIEVVREYASPLGGETLLDGYSGVGTFGLSLADQAGQVIGVEEDESAFLDAQFNAQGTPHTTFVQGPMEGVLSSLKGVDLAILDPPRQGCSGEALAALLKLAPARIVYVSCDPATLARDVKRLGEGGYRLLKVQPVDLFPQTYHIESVSLLER